MSDSHAASLDQSYATQGLIVWLAMLSVSFYNFQPLLVGGFITLLEISESQAGLIATANLIGVCLSLALISLRRASWTNRNILIVALTLMVAGNVLSAFAGSFEALVVVRFLTGFGEGLAMAFAVSCISLFKKPDRLYALVMVGMSLYGMLGYLVFPQMLQQFGLLGVFFALALLPLLSVILIRWVPEYSQSDDHQPTSVAQILFHWPVVLVLASVMLVYISTNGVWTYYERIGTALSVSLDEIGIALSLGLFASLVGGITAAIMSDRFGRLLPVSIGIALAVLSMAILYLADGYTAYVISVMLLFGTTGMILPYYIGTFASLDGSGRLPVLGKLSLYTGNFVGPAMAAGLVSPGKYTTLIAVSGWLFVVALVLFAVAYRMSANRAQQLSNA